MRGTVLGFADEKGVIVTEDDRRYPFTMANWRDEQPPVRGAVVDFVERDGNADDIYLALGARPPRPVGPAGVGQNDGLRRFMDKLKAFPQLGVAALVLIIFLLVTYATVPSGMQGVNREMRDYPTLVGLNGALSEAREEVRDGLEDLERGREQLRSVGGGPVDEFRAKQMRTSERVGGALSWLSWVLAFAMFFWLIPLAAIGVIALYLLGRRMLAVISSIVLAVLCVFSGVYMWLLEGAALNVVSAGSGPGEEINRSARRALERSFELGVGGWLLLFCGIALIVLLFVRRGSAPAVAA